jgi:HD-GYP domain-containing protein (c-di-GMP phosphodiesterase class II)
LNSVFAGDRTRTRDIAAAFGEVVDIKSPYTGTHSIGTASAAVAMGEMLGLDGDRIWNLELAALLHDLGKLSVPTNLLNKRTNLESDDWLIIRSHPEFTRPALIQTDLFEPVAALAASHHERLDGSGYPQSMLAEDLGLENRILAVADVFDALCADRPYRDPLTRVEIFRIMDGMVGEHLDGDAVRALESSV